MARWSIPLLWRFPAPRTGVNIQCRCGEMRKVDEQSLIAAMVFDSPRLFRFCDVSLGQSKLTGFGVQI